MSAMDLFYAARDPGGHPGRHVEGRFQRRRNVGHAGGAGGAAGRSRCHHAADPHHPRHGQRRIVLEDMERQEPPSASAGACIGVGLGYQFAASVSRCAVSLAVGFISVTFGFYRLVIERRNDPVDPTRTWACFICGIGSGVTSMIVHAGGPPFQMFVMPQQKPAHHTFVGTSVIFFGDEPMKVLLISSSASSARAVSPCR